MTTVHIKVELDEDAIREHLPLEKWATLLKLHGVDEGNEESGPRAIEPDWEAVFEKIAVAWIGCQEYKDYSQTAMDDVLFFERFVLNEGITLTDQAPPAARTAKAAKVLPMPHKKNGNGS